MTALCVSCSAAGQLPDTVLQVNRAVCNHAHLLLMLSCELKIALGVSCNDGSVSYASSARAVCGHIERQNLITELMRGTCGTCTEFAAYILALWLLSTLITLAQKLHRL